MRKKLVLVLLTSVAAVCMAAAKSPDIVGTWRMISQNGEPTPDSYTNTKMITATHFMWMLSDVEGNIIVGAGGRYKLEGSKYTESIDIVLPGMKSFYGTTASYEVQVKGNRMEIKGHVNDVENSEVWEKIE